MIQFLQWCVFFLNAGLSDSCQITLVVDYLEYNIWVSICWVLQSRKESCLEDFGTLALIYHLRCTEFPFFWWLKSAVEGLTKTRIGLSILHKLEGKENNFKNSKKRCVKLFLITWFYVACFKPVAPLNHERKNKICFLQQCFKL